jgi:hypothetical protein
MSGAVSAYKSRSLLIIYSNKWQGRDADPVLI